MLAASLGVHSMEHSWKEDCLETSSTKPADQRIRTKPTRASMKQSWNYEWQGARFTVVQEWRDGVEAKTTRPGA